MQKSKELPLDKKYNLKEYVIVSYENLHIAIFPEIASWILLKNTVQEKFSSPLPTQNFAFKN